MSIHRRRRDRSAGESRVETVRARIIEAAAQIIGEGGPSALTIERLAALLHRRPTSIRRLFRDLDEILDVVTLQALQELVELLQDAVGGRDGRQALEALLEAQRLYARARPGMYEAALRRPSLVTAEVVRMEEAFIRVECAALEACGASARDAFRLAWCLRAAVQGAIDLEARDGVTTPHEIDLNFDRIVSLLETASRPTLAPSTRSSPTPAWRPVVYGADRA